MNDLIHSSPATGTASNSLALFGGSGLSRQTRKAIENIDASADVEVARDSARALLTSTAMANTSHLISQAKHHLQSDPEAAPYLEPLVRAYAQGAALRIQRMG